MARLTKQRTVPLILVDESLCKRCGICIHFCPTRVFDTRQDGLPIVARRDDCIWCSLCEVRCPDFAILLKAEGPAPQGAARPGGAATRAEAPESGEGGGR